MVAVDAMIEGVVEVKIVEPATGLVMTVEVDFTTDEYGQIIVLCLFSKEDDIEIPYENLSATSKLDIDEACRERLLL